MSAFSNSKPTRGRSLVGRMKNLFVSSGGSKDVSSAMDESLQNTEEVKNRHAMDETAMDKKKTNMQDGETQTLSTFYISHASPMLFITDCPGTDFMRSWRKHILPQTPKAVVVISAHWDTREPSVSTIARNTTIYDFYGFPSELYKLQYNAPGAPDVAKRVKELLQQAGVNPVHEDPKRGLDHGAWTPLKLMYPEEDIPCFQLSIQSRKDAAHHFRLGRALAPLKEEGVLILASGSLTHNLSPTSFQDKPTPTWAKDFEAWVDDCVLNGKYEELMDFEKKAPYAKTAHPTPDHFLPLLVAAGAAGEGAEGEKVHSSMIRSALSMGSYAFRPVASKAKES